MFPLRAEHSGLPHVAVLAGVADEAVALTHNLLPKQYLCKRLYDVTRLAILELMQHEISLWRRCLLPSNAVIFTSVHLLSGRGERQEVFKEMLLCDRAPLEASKEMSLALLLSVPLS